MQARSGMDFPVSYELNGPDTFLLQLDALMRKRSGRGNICHFLVTLASPLDRETVQQHLSRQPIVQWLATLRLRGGRGYSPPRWCVDPKASLPPIPFAPLPATDSGDVLGTTVSVNPRQASPFQIRLFGCDPQTTHVLFVWHHALMDAHGAELLVTYLGQALDAEPLFFDPDPLRPNHREWKLALGIKETLYAITR
ncbi:MAG: hypothetical protein O3A51_10820, partial [Verrucomicrobia bacterium]|nr:hypothetical protein [Verrucomicrobiota bacterium]